MDDSGPTANIILFFVLLLLNFWMYGFDTALRSMNEPEVDKKAEEDRKSVRLRKMLDSRAKCIYTVYMVTIICNMINGYLCFGAICSRMKSWLQALATQLLKIASPNETVVMIAAVIISVIVCSYIIMTIGVLLPKKFAERFPEKWALFWIHPMYDLMIILTPFTGLVSLTADLFLKLFGEKSKENEAEVIEDEIISMVYEGHEQGYIEASEAKMISNIFEFGDKEVQDIMTHRSQIVAFPSDMTLGEAIEHMLSEKYSRFPVYEETIDHIIGVLFFKDAMRLKASEKLLVKPISQINGLLRKPFCVPQTKNIDELFRKMQAEKVQMAFVIDEYGQTDGLVAMEDILEEIVGNILDEYDDESGNIKKTGEDEYVIEGLTPLEELEERFHISFEDEPYETLNGFLISRLDRIPDNNEKFELDYQGYHFRILSVENKVITSVLVKHLEEKTEEKSGKTEEETIPR